MPSPPAEQRRNHAGPPRQKRAIPIHEAASGLLVRRVDVRPPDVVFVKGILEASEGLAALFAERGGELVIAAPPDREADLDELLADLAAEIDLRVAKDDR